MLSKKGNLVLGKLVKLILILVVIVIFIFVFIGLRNLGVFDMIFQLPDYLPGNQSIIDKPPECEELVGVIHKDNIYLLERGDYRKTPIYIKIKKGRIMLDKESDIELGFVKTEDSNIYIYDFYLNEKDPEFIKEDISSYVSVENLLLLKDSYIPGVGGVICKTYSQMREFDKRVRCVESCELHNGECLSNSVGEISYGRLDCPENRECFVEEEGEILEDEDLKIEKFLFEDGKEENSFKYKIKSEDSYCFLARTNKEIITNRYFKGDVELGFGFDYSDEENFELVAWKPWDDKKVLKRVKLERVDNKEYIQNEDFKEKLIVLKKGVFYFTTNKRIAFDYPGILRADELAINKFRIEINNENLMIFGFYKNVDEEKEEWHVLDCKKWGIGGGINKNNLESSFIETVTKHCGLNW